MIVQVKRKTVLQRSLKRQRKNSNQIEKQSMGISQLQSPKLLRLHKMKCLHLTVRCAILTPGWRSHVLLLSMARGR